MQDERPDQTPHIDTANRINGITINGKRGGKSGRIIFVGRGSEDLAPTWRIERIHFASRAG